MPSLFAACVVDKTIPAEKLLDTVRSHQTRGFSGLVEAGYADGGYLDFLLFKGHLVAFYIRNPAGLILVPVNKWDQVVLMQTYAQYTCSRLSMSTQALRLAKIRLAQAAQGQLFTNLPTASLSGQIAQWRNRPASALLHIRWDDADGLALLPGQKQEVEDVVLLSAGEVLPDRQTAAGLVNWDRRECSIAILNRVKSEAWDEYLVQNAFARFTESLLRRFGEVTGRVLVNSVTRSLNVTAVSKGWDVSILEMHVQNQEVFPSLTDTSDASRILLSLLLKTMESLVGGSLLKLITKDVLAEIDDTCLQMLNAHSLLPDAFLSLYYKRTP